MRVGTVKQIWRHPVKSMRGERIESCAPQPRVGIPGDRGWALRDEIVQEIRGAKKLPRILQCAARYLEEPTGADVPHVEITLPDGATALSEDPNVSQILSRALEREVTLWPRQPAEDLEHYRRRESTDDVEALVREASGLLPEEPLPDMSVVDPLAIEYVSPPGTYFDYYELHLVTTASLAELARLTPGARVDPRRFRPNLLIEALEGASGFVEFDWCGRDLEIGRARIRAVHPMMRCAMTTWPQDDLPKAPAIMRSLVRHAQQNLGIGLWVVSPGKIRVGDSVELI